MFLYTYIDYTDLIAADLVVMETESSTENEVQHLGWTI